MKKRIHSAVILSLSILMLGLASCSARRGTKPCDCPSWAQSNSATIQAIDARN